MEAQEKIQQTRKRKRWLRPRFSYIGSLTLGSILLVTIPLSIAMLVAGQRIVRYMEQTVQQRVDQTVGYLNTTLDQYFSELRDLTILPLYDGDVQTVLLAHADPEQQKYLTFEEQSKATAALSSIVYEKPTVRSTDLYLLDGNQLNSSSSVLKWTHGERKWMEVCDGDQYRTFILPWGGSLALVRRLQDPLTGRHAGYIKVELEQSAVPSLLQQVSLPEGSELSICNDVGQRIYPLPGGGPAPGGSGEKYLSGFMTSASTNLKVVVRVATSGLEEDIRALFSFAVAVIACALALSWLFAVAASVKLTRPILELKEKMAQVGEGRFSTRATEQSRDEIGQLEAMFNSMAESIEMLINEVYEESLASKEAQISALQSQINPHFLYNTLETINMMAINCENYEVSEAVSNLGQMMHYCVSNEQHFAPLAEELRFLQAYYDIQTLRFEDLRSLRVNAPEEVLGLPVPKLLLQPFVENIMRHGLDTASHRPLDIWLTARLAGSGQLVLVIQNNGRPMTGQERQRVNENLRKAESTPPNAPWKASGHGYGLTNVHRRLRLIYGEACGVFLDDSYTDGVRFVLRLGCAPHGAG